MHKTTESHKNPEIEVIMNKSQRSKGQTKNFNRRRHLSRLHNNNSGLKKELVWTVKDKGILLGTVKEKD